MHTKYGYVPNARKKICLFGNELLPKFYDSFKARAGGNIPEMKKMFIAEREGNILSIKNWKNAKVNLTISYPITQLVLAIFLQRITSQNHTTMQILCDVKDSLLKYSIRVKRLKQRLLTMIMASFRKQVESCKQDLPVITNSNQI